MLATLVAQLQVPRGKSGRRPPLDRAVGWAADPSLRLTMPGTAVHVMGDDSEAAWGECFICTQEAPISSLVHGVCACRERYMHVACQRQMLEQSAFSESCQVPTCPVCHSEYTNSRMEFKQAPLMSPDQLLQTRLRAHLPSPSHRCPVQTGAAHAPRPIAPDSPSRPHTLALSSVPRAVCPTRA